MSLLASATGLRLIESIAGPHGIDGYLEQIRPTLVVGECRAEVVTAERGEESVTLTLQPNRAWRGFRAGQFVQVTVEIDGVRHTRCYSPASAEGEARELEITVKRHPEGLVSNFLVDRAAPGMVVGLSAAEGEFQLPTARPEIVLLIGGGSGITPLMSIARTLCAEGYGGHLTLIQYAPDPGRAIYRRELERLAADHPSFNLLRSYTRARGDGELDGHFNPTHLSRAEPAFAGAETFACGPPPLIEALRGTWTGELEGRLHVESFVPPNLVPLDQPGEGSIHFAESGVEIPNSGAPLLEQAEDAGIPAEFGCRMGICHTCSRRKLSGTVKNLVTGDVSSQSDEEIQLCVSAPLGDLVVQL